MPTVESAPSAARDSNRPKIKFNLAETFENPMKIFLVPLLVTALLVAPGVSLASPPPPRKLA
jgi:hypothetical protein